jgi:hypothetical protein
MVSGDFVSGTIDAMGGRCVLGARNEWQGRSGRAAVSQSPAAQSAPMSAPIKGANSRPRWYGCLSTLSVTAIAVLYFPHGLIVVPFKYVAPLHPCTQLQLNILKDDLVVS